MKKLYQRLSLSMALLLLVISVGLAQERVVTGVIKDNEGTTMPGVNVLVKGTTLGTVTDSNGAFSISAPANSTLVFSFVGFKTMEKPVGEQTKIDVLLESDLTSLDEIVVIGYGTQKRSDLTGAVGSVDEDQLKERPSSSLNQGLAGKVAGVQVNNNSGRPGGRSTVRIRGFSSINSSNNPLYVIDGVQMPQGTKDQFSSAIDYINPNDVVSMEVLKDASSTAIYGARGANGVILITTRRGKSGEGKVTYDVDFSVPTKGPNSREVLNAEEYMATEDLAWQNMAKFDPVGWNAGKWAYLNPALRRTDPRVFDANGNNLYDTDWLKETTQSRFSQNHQLGFSGGNERTTYSLSLGYRNDVGYVKTSYQTRYSGRFSIDDQIKKWMKIGGTLAYNYQTENLVDINDAVARQIVEDFPFLPVTYEDGSFASNRDFPYAEGTYSSMARLYGRKYILNTQTLMGSVFADITLAKGLSFRSVLGANIVTQENNESSASFLSPSGIATAATSNSREPFWSFENYLTYNKTFNDIHSFTGLLGLSWQQTNYFIIDQGARNFPSDYFSYNNMGAGSDNRTVFSNAQQHSLNSFFGRINYSLMGKYLVTFTGRADGSSKFGDNNKYAFFPSAALAWRVSDESFLSDNSVISNLKLRTSYGLTGNSEIPPYSSLSLLGSGYRAVWNDVAVGGTGINRLANPDLRWEKTAQTDLGIELGLFNNRVMLETDFYYRKTTDMLLDAPVPQSSGYAIIRKNVGSMENKGIELTLTSVNVNSGNLTWNTTFNISFNQNKVLSLATPSDIFNVGGPNFTNPTNIIRVGEPVGSFWGLNRLGTWSEAEREEAAKFVSYRNGLTILPGDIKYEDVNGDYIINDADRKIIGNGSPKAWGAFTNTVRFKQLDFTLELQYSLGNDIMDMNLHPSEDRQALANSYKSVLNAWTPENQNTMIAQVRDTRAGYVTNVDTHWIKDGSFLRGRNLVLGYNFQPAFLDKMKMSKLRIFGSVQNFFLVVEDELYGDPEITPTNQGGGNSAFSQGMMWHEYPKSTLWMAGLNIGF